MVEMIEPSNGLHLRGRNGALHQIEVAGAAVHCYCEMLGTSISS
jgi:hypothetical protein